MFNLGMRYSPDFGLRLGATLHFQDKRVASIINPNNGGLLFAATQTQRIDPYVNVFAKVGWDFGNWQLGVIGERLQADDHTEFPGLDNVALPEDLSPPRSGDRFGGEELAPRAYLYVEGQF